MKKIVKGGKFNYLSWIWGGITGLGLIGVVVYLLKRHGNERATDSL